MTLIHRLISFAIIAVLLAMTPAASAADGFATLSYPVEVSVEGNSIPTTIHMKFDIRRYDVPLVTFAARSLDPREAKFAEWMQTVAARNYTRAERMLEQVRSVKPAVANSDEPSRVVVAERTPKQVVDMYHNAFGGFRDVKVIAQIRAGSKSLFVWEAKGGESKIRRAFAVDDSLAVSEVTMATPVELLIVNNVMDRGARDTTLDRGIPGFKAPFELAFPLEGAWNAGPHPVVLQFSGRPVDILFPAETPAATGEVAAFYQSAYGALREGDVERFISHMTSRSQEKWVRWYRSLTPASAEQYLAAAKAPRAIRFVLDAGPLLIVFHGDRENWEAGSLDYDYLLRSVPGGDLKLANVAFSGFFDDVIGSPTLFDQNILRAQVVAEANR